MAEHHGPARVGVRYLVVVPRVPVPRPFIVANFTRAGDSQGCVRRDETGFQVRV